MGIEKRTKIVKESYSHTKKSNKINGSDTMS